ncbi:MAG TPA: Gfo/Idh/MocA family oxidoreductase [Acidobacteriaceae bacterium]|nr:Gfo/Idh/MocA family oxidoreductase [Acidobacteriaceae bacterium]
MDELIRVGVIGFGLAGRYFHAGVIQGTAGLELACIVQRSGDEAARAYPGVAVARSVDELLADSSIRLVIIATPNDSHDKLASECLREGRHVVVDKPFTLSTAEAAGLIRMARERKLLLSVYQNRRWDGDFQTVRQILAGGELGRIVAFESHFDRFRPAPRRERWRESGGLGGGILWDIGPHLIDQALVLFGTPRWLTASVRIERDGAVVDDAWDILLEYEKPHSFTALLRSTLTACIPGPRFVLHGMRGSFMKWGLDAQEEQLNSGMTYESPGIGEQPESAWGELRLCEGGTRRVPTLRGDYRAFYANVRDALLGRSELEVTPEQAWRTIRLIELARESSRDGRRVAVEFEGQP